MALVHHRTQANDLRLGAGERRGARVEHSPVIRAGVHRSESHQLGKGSRRLGGAGQGSLGRPRTHFLRALTISQPQARRRGVERSTTPAAEGHCKWPHQARGLESNVTAADAPRAATCIDAGRGAAGRTLLQTLNVLLWLRRARTRESPRGGRARAALEGDRDGAFGLRGRGAHAGAAFLAAAVGDWARSVIAAVCTWSPRTGRTRAGNGGIRGRIVSATQRGCFGRCISQRQPREQHGGPRQPRRGSHPCACAVRRQSFGDRAFRAAWAGKARDFDFPACRAALSHAASHLA